MADLDGSDGGILLHRRISAASHQDLAHPVDKGHFPGDVLVLVLGIILWLAYGLVIQDIPLIAANATTLLFAGTILFFKLKHG